MWQYTADTDMPTHRQWMLVPILTGEDPVPVDDIEKVTAESGVADGIYDLQGRPVGTAQQTLKPGIYVVRRNGTTIKELVK